MTIEHGHNPSSHQDLRSLPLISRYKSHLLKAGYVSPYEVLLDAPSTISRRTRLGPVDVELLVKEISKCVQPAIGTVSAKVSRLVDGDGVEAGIRTTTGDAGLDTLLSGGIPLRSVTEVAGESSTGKTQLCIQLAVHVQLPISLGGLEGGAIWIGSEGSFPTSRMLEMGGGLLRRLRGKICGFSGVEGGSGLDDGGSQEGHEFGNGKGKGKRKLVDDDDDEYDHPESPLFLRPGPSPFKTFESASTFHAREIQQSKEASEWARSRGSRDLGNNIHLFRCHTIQNLIHAVETAVPAFLDGKMAGGSSSKTPTEVNTSVSDLQADSVAVGFAVHDTAKSGFDGQPHPSLPPRPTPGAEDWYIPDSQAPDPGFFSFTRVPATQPDGAHVAQSDSNLQTTGPSPPPQPEAEIPHPPSLPIRLLIIDSIAAPFRAEFANNTEGMVKRSKDLNLIGDRLKVLAEDYDLAIVVINQVSDSFSARPSGTFAGPSRERQDASNGMSYKGQSAWFSGERASLRSGHEGGDGEGSNGKVASLGLAWTNSVNTRLMLSHTGTKLHRRNPGSPTDDYGTPRPFKVPRIEDRLASNEEEYGSYGDFGLSSGLPSIRKASLVFSPSAPRASIEYIINSDGVCTISETSLLRSLEMGASHAEDDHNSDSEEEAYWKNFPGSDGLSVELDEGREAVGSATSSPGPLVASDA